MKYIYALLIVLGLLFTLGDYSSANSSIDWDKIQIASRYNPDQNQLLLYTSLFHSQSPVYDYTLELDVESRWYTQKFYYNSKTRFFHTSFNIPKNTTVVNIPFIFSIFEEGRHVYKGEWVFNLDSTELQSVSFQQIHLQTDTDSLSQERQELREAFIKSIPESLTTKSEKREFANTLISKLLIYNAESNQSDPRILLLLEEIQIYSQREFSEDVVAESIVEQTSSQNPFTKPVPFYTSRFQEARRINGIWNIPSYSSWRIEK